MMSELPPCKLRKRDLYEFFCGWGAAVINICTTYPLHKIIFRQMVHNMKFKEAIKEVSEQGPIYLYRGILPPLFQKSVVTSFMFGTYESLRCRLEVLGLDKPSSRLWAATLSGTAETALTPFERIQSLMQHSNYHKMFKNSMDASRTIAVTYGVKEFYRGFVPILLRNGLGNVMFFTLREEAGKGFPKPRSLIGSVSKEFFVGAFSGAAASSLVFPFNVIKVHIQSKLGEPYLSTWAHTKEIYQARDRSISNFYRGIHLNLTRSFISWGVINIAYENLKKIFIQD